MGNKQSKIPDKDYVITEERENFILAKKGEETFLVKKILQTQSQDIEVLKTTSHPHIVDCKNSFTDKTENMYYVVMEYCQGGNLAKEIQEMEEPPQESEVLSRMAEICIALRTIHDKGLLHKDLTPENIFLTEFGIVRLGGFEAFHQKRKNTSNADSKQNLNYLAPEVFTVGTYDSKSDIWSVGCILFELCTTKSAFSAETAVTLIPKIISGAYPALPEHFSPALCELLNDILQKDPEPRPTASEILAHPIFISCLKEKCKTTVEDLYTKLNNLRTLADGLENVHEGTTIGSLTGGVIGAVGGITSIVGLILAPFTLGASLIVTGVGVGVGALGGVTAGASNITNMVNQSSDRKAVHNLIKEFEQKINAVVIWLREISDSLQTLSNQCPQASDTDGNFNTENLTRLGFRAGKGIGGIAELVRLAQVVNIGKIAAQASRTVRVAEVATGVLSGLFIAVDIFFIAMDAKEIHNIKQARAADQGLEESEPPDKLPLQKPEVKSEIMRFVNSVREAADNLKEVLDELEDMISSIPSVQAENELEWQNMELM
ncbi:CBL-interacting protein kinase 24-like isoform X2 [Melanotaenia boesemani]|uniref:CBL-interacting protein kinase 24-like isoform X2 n=1 Tax=Melanotaenia boesemani TaxID=1250792 RepID=UPI001C050937|nr:CBL-interacting protein kinase 24-like isoform X2 [Melanotaenia boesemani]XP_041845879.1 CBL-interacting protein kinase 24-like isoform X2 [Melanotaenia boesemani]